ncbi:MAG: hypothetical protein CMO34_04095 [Verrucomicrobia bacterium]|nr:hypothetical protein [Verrucomicrobiota bacterium]
MKKLEAKEVDAVVYDRPQLLYFLKEYNGDELYICKAEYFKQGYGFAFPIGSSLTMKINRVLVGLAERQKVESIIYKYIQKDE